MIYLIIETILLIGAIITIILLSILLEIAEHKIDKAIEYINTHDDSFYQEKGLNEDSLNNLLNILENGSEVK